MPNYSYVRIYTDDDGDSHFEDVTVELAEAHYAPPAPPAFTGGSQDALESHFLLAETGWDGIWHPVPHRQFMAILSGLVEVQVSDGESRTLGAGDLGLFEDTTGKGHYSRVPPTSEDCVVLVTTLSDI